MNNSVDSTETKSNVATNEANNDTPTVEQLMAQLAQEKANNAKMKNSFDKASSEAAEYKRQLRAKQTAEEQEADAKREADEAREARIKELEDYRATNEAMKRYMNVVGMSADLAEKAAIAEVSGDYDALAEIQKQHSEAQRREWEKEFLKNRPALNTGSGSTMTKEEILAVKDSHERQRLIAQNINLFKN